MPENEHTYKFTFDAFQSFSFALVSQSLIPLFSRAFYAMLNTKTPVIVGLLSMLLNIFLAYELASQHGVVGIALGFVLANLANCLVLFLLLHRKLNKHKEENKEIRAFDMGLLYAVLKIIIASFCMGLVAYSAIYAVSPFVNTRTVLGILVQSGLACGLAGVTYLIATYVMGIHETHKILQFFDNYLSPKWAKKTRFLK
jgi:putative peptidoglycan lipid II flippase